MVESNFCLSHVCELPFESRAQCSIRYWGESPSSGPQCIEARAGCPGKDETPLHVAVALLTSLRAMITHDDDRPPASKAFMHARMLALNRGAVPVFLSVLRRALASPPELCAAISALQALCANDDVCKQVRRRPVFCIGCLASHQALRWGRHLHKGKMHPDVAT